MRCEAVRGRNDFVTSKVQHADSACGVTAVTFDKRGNHHEHGYRSRADSALVAVGLIGLHWASMIEARDEAGRWEALEQALAEAVREKARQAAELEAMRADLRHHGAAVRC